DIEPSIQARITLDMQAVGTAAPEVGIDPQRALPGLLEIARDRRAVDNGIAADDKRAVVDHAGIVAPRAYQYAALGRRARPAGSRRRDRAQVIDRARRHTVRRMQQDVAGDGP